MWARDVRPWGFCSREDAAERMRSMIVRAVRLQEVESGTQGAALGEIAETYGISERWMKRVMRREPGFTLHLEFYEALLRALDDLIQKHEARLAQEKAALALLRGGHAVAGAYPEAHSRADGTGQDEIGT